MTSDSKHNSCPHCGQPSIGGDFCCLGCRFANKLIHNAGLENFYNQSGPRDPVGQVALNDFEAFDHSDFLETKTTKNGSQRTARFLIEGLQCPACLWLIEKLPSLATNCLRAEVNFSNESLLLVWKDGEKHLSGILRVLAQLGYKIHPFEEDQRKKLSRRSDWIRVGISGASASASMHIAILFYAGYSHKMENTDAIRLGLFSAFLSLPAVFYGGLPFFRSAVSSIRLRLLHPDLLISAALILGFIVSVVRTIQGNIEVYYDSLAMVTFLLLIGRAVVAQGSRVKSFGYLWKARLMLDEGEVSVPTSSLKPNDIIRVHSQEEVPIDIELIDNEAWLNESVVTGESRSERRLKGQELLEGSRNDGASFRGRVLRAASTSSLSNLVSRVQQISISSSISKVEQLFSSGILLLVLLVLVFSREDAFSKALALLVVTCPCALLLAKPLLLEMTRAEGLKHGILFVNLYRFLNSTPLREVAFDKTGTLTEGRAIVVREELCDGHIPEDLFSASYALSLKSSHPLARALALRLENRVRSEVSLSDWMETPGMGVTARWGEHRLRLASSDRKEGISRPSCAIFLDDRELLRFEFDDPIRKDWRKTAVALAKNGFSLKVLSGDREESVEDFAEQTSRIWSKAIGGLKPDEKVKYLSQESVYVGDGLNDALSMKAAGFSIGFSGSAESNIGAADVYLLNKDLSLVPRILAARKRAWFLLKAGHATSIAYNLVTIGLVLNGSIGPIICAIFMPLSSLSVLFIARSMRL